MTGYYELCVRESIFYVRNGTTPRGLVGICQIALFTALCLYHAATKKYLFGRYLNYDIVSRMRFSKIAALHFFASDI